MYLFILTNAFVQNLKYICPICKKLLYKLKMYLSKWSAWFYYEASPVAQTGGQTCHRSQMLRLLYTCKMPTAHSIFWCDTQGKLVNRHVTTATTVENTHCSYSLCSLMHYLTYSLSQCWCIMISHIWHKFNHHTFHCILLWSKPVNKTGG